MDTEIIFDVGISARKSLNKQVPSMKIQGDMDIMAMLASPSFRSFRTRYLRCVYMHLLQHASTTYCINAYKVTHTTKINSSNREACIFDGAREIWKNELRQTAYEKAREWTMDQISKLRLSFFFPEQNGIEYFDLNKHIKILGFILSARTEGTSQFPYAKMFKKKFESIYNDADRRNGVLIIKMIYFEASGVSYLSTEESLLNYYFTHHFPLSDPDLPNIESILPWMRYEVTYQVTATGISAQNKRQADTEEDDTYVECVGTITREEKDAKLRKLAICLD